MLAHKGRRVEPVFVIEVRADELPLLQELQAAFGGTLYYARTHRSYRWQVQKRGICRELVAYFDRFPLRSKKARDYVLWRRAVTVISERGSRDLELFALRDALMEGRKFGASEVIVPVHDDGQLKLEAD